MLNVEPTGHMRSAICVYTSIVLNILSITLDEILCADSNIQFKKERLSRYMNVPVLLHKYTVELMRLNQRQEAKICYK